MTDFGTLEASTEGSRPVELYRFVLGGEEFLYTSNSSDFVLGSTYEGGIGLSRGEIARGRDERRRVLPIKFPLTNPFARKYVGIPPGLRARVTISRAQRDETPSITKRDIYHGFVLSALFPDPATVQLQCQSIEAVVGRHVPRYTYMGSCNHVHGGPECGVDLTAHTFAGTVVAVAGNVITVAGAGASGFDFTAGFVRPAGVSDPRMVLAQDGDDLTLMIPFHAEILNANVDCIAGCDHGYFGDCAITYDNVIRFGGFPYVPKRNIHTQGVL